MSSGQVCYPVEQPIASFCVPVLHPLAMEYDTLSMDWTGLDGTGRLHFPSSSPSQQGVDQNGSTTVFSDCDCSGLGSTTMVLATSVTPSGEICHS